MCFMNKKNTIILTIFLLLITLFIQGIAVSIMNKVSVNLYCVVAAFSAIPFACLVLFLTKLINEKYRILRLILRGYAFVLIIIFIVVCLLAITLGFDRDYYGGAVFRLG